MWTSGLRDLEMSTFSRLTEISLFSFVRSISILWTLVYSVRTKALHSCSNGATVMSCFPGRPDSIACPVGSSFCNIGNCAAHSCN